MIRASGALTASQGRDYYDREYSRGDYYTEDGKDVSGVWSGKGAERLGLCGAVEKEVFDAVLEGKAGRTGEQLIPGEVGTGKHRAGWDFTCSPDKSVSILALVGGDAGVVEDVRASNARAMVELERFALAKDRERNLETSGNLVIASFLHETSRRLDPQLHIHNVVMNMTRRQDGKFVGLETREMFAAQAFVKAVFHADLARRLQARGYEIDVREGGVVAIREVPKSLVEAFSQRRRKDIEPYLAARGQSGAKAAENAAIRTRKVKDHDVDREALRTFWAATARGQGVDLEAIRQRAEKVRSAGVAPPDPNEKSLRAQSALAFARDHLSERKAAFAGHQLLGAALRQGMGEVVLEEVRAALPKDPNLVQVDLEACPSHRYTTDQALALERRNIAFMRSGRGTGRAILDGRPFEPGRPLSASQLRVAEHVLSSRDQVLAVEGKAGAGKTYTLQAVVAEAGARGWLVRGFAPDTSAVKTLATEAGLSAKTLAALAQERSGQTREPQLWLVDEAGKMSSKLAEALFGKARETGAKVVLVGDRLQHAAVEAGMPFAYLQEAGLRAERLDEIRRQKDPGLLDAVVDASEGRTREAVARLMAMEKVVEHPDRSSRHQAVVQDFLATPSGQTCIVIAPSNEERRDLNRRIREALIEAGRVERRSLEAKIRVSRGLTLAQRKEVQSYQVGDLLVFPRASKVFGIDQGAQGRVAGVNLERKTIQVDLSDGRRAEFAPSRFASAEVFRVEGRRFAVGDRIQYREAQKPEGQRVQGQGFRIANGDTGVLRRLDLSSGLAELELDGPSRRVSLDLGRIQPVDHAYAITSHSSQGRTEDRSLVVVDTLLGRELVNRQQFYVSISRARLEAKVYTSSREDLAAAVSRDAAKGSALALVQGKHNKREVSLGVDREIRTERTPDARGARPGGRDATKAFHRTGIAREACVVFERGLPGCAGGHAEPAPAIEERGRPAGGPIERVGPDPQPAPGLDAGGRRGVGGLVRTQPDRPGGPGRGLAEPDRGQGPAGGIPAVAPPGDDRGQGRGHRPPGGGPAEPRLGGAVLDGRLRHGGRDRDAVRPAGDRDPGRPGAEPDQNGRGGRDAPGCADPAPSGRIEALDLGGREPGHAPGRGSGAAPGPVDSKRKEDGMESETGLLQREAGAPALVVPDRLKHLAADLQRLSARFRACGLEDPLKGAALKELPPAVLRGALEEARGRGVLEEGTDWAQRRSQLPSVAENLRVELERQVGPSGPGLGRGA